MPLIPLNQDNAWSYWKEGKIAATNTDQGVDAPNTIGILANLAHKRRYNAIRLWLTWAITTAQDYSLLPQDWRVIGWNGWDSPVMASTATQHTAGTSQPVTLAQVRDQIQRVLDRCRDLGLGVILTGEFFSRTRPDGQLGRLWVDSLAGDDFPENTTAAGLQGDLAMFWQKTILKFGSHPALIGIDLVNEPGYNNTLPMADKRGTRKDTWPQLANYLVPMIRQVDPSGASDPSKRVALIVQGDLRLFVNSANASDTSYLIRDRKKDGSFYTSLTDERVIYSLHMYEPDQFTGQGVFGYNYLALGSTFPPSGLMRIYDNDESGAPQPVIFDYRTAQGWDKLHPEADVLKNLGMPIFVGEFGAIQPNLGWVTPDDPNRAAKGQRVSETPIPAPGANVTTARYAATQQVTSIVKDPSGQFYTFYLGNVGSWFEPVSFIDPNAVKSMPGYSIDTNGYPTGPDIHTYWDWKPQWFVNNQLKATIYLIGAGNALGATPVVTNAAITVTGNGTNPLSFTVPASQVAASLTSMAGSGTSPGIAPVAILKATSAATESDISIARATYIKTVIAWCQRRKYSWAYFSDDYDTMGFVGWRPDSISRLIIDSGADGALLS